MTSWDVRLLTASYRREGPGEEPVIELFGRTRDGESIVVEHRGFKPYFFCVRPPAALVSYLKRDESEVVDVRDVELESSGEKVPCGQVILRHPWRTPEYRERCRKYGSEVLAADIPFPHRFIYDMDLPSAFRVHGTRIESDLYPVDLVVEAERFEETDPFPPTLKVLSFDLENTLGDPTVLCLGVAWREDGEIRTKIFHGDERSILHDFLAFVRAFDPDVLTGYNIDGYDLPVLEARSRALGLGPLRLSRDDVPISHVGDRFWRAHGRVVADAWWSVKLELHPKQETLDAVARSLLGEGKEDVDRLRMGEEWARDPDKVMAYCMKDAELALRILEKVNRLNKALDLAYVSKLPLDDAFNSRTSTLIDSLLIRAADRAKVAVPMTRGGRRGASIEGGYVHTLRPGLYEWVAVLDFLSMYPSIIIENNICFTTQSDRGTTVSPIGVRFLAKEEREGLLPRILADLMDRRAEVKVKLKSASDPEEREYYDRVQFAVKILMNAFYGVLASSFYRFTNPDIGASITAFARENIKKVIADLEADGVPVVYSDTDSIFYQSPTPELAATLAHGRKVAERFSHGTVNMEFERVFRTLFSHGKKKRYAALVEWPEAQRGEIVVRGYEIRRTDAFELQSRAQMEVFELILHNDVDSAIERAKELVATLASGTIPGDMVSEDQTPVELLVISRTVREDARYVNPDAMANVQAAKKLRELGYEVVSGMKVSWIVVDGKRAPMQVEPYASGRPFEFTPDWSYYARRLAQTLAYVTEVYGWDEKALLTGSLAPKQVRLDSDTFEDGGEPRKRGVRKTNGALTLEDFL